MGRRGLRGLLVGSCAAVLVWANWQEPDLHSYVAPITTVLLRLEGLPANVKPISLERQLSAEPGVSACSVQPQTGVAALVYDPALTSVDAIRRAFGRAGVARAVPLPRAAPAQVAGPQCPVPAGYVVALERVRFALNFRRWWVRV